MTTYEDFIARKQREYGDRFDPSSLAPQFVPYFNSGQRIKVRTGDYVRTGTVEVTTGWVPVFMLMRRSNAYGSSDTLGPKDEIVAVQHGRKYIPLLG